MAVISTVFQLKTAVVGLFVVLGSFEISRAADNGQTLAKELVQYIHEAKRRGLAETKIKKQALAVGWSEASIDEAIAYEKSGKPLPSRPAPEAATSTPAQALAPAAEPVLPAEAAVPPAAPEKAAVSLAGPPRLPGGTGGSDDYRIGSGDTLQVSVWKEPEASVPTGVVRPDGKITVPLIKEVEVAGLTPRQAEAVITERIGKFITDPNVTVVVATINSKKIYLIGAVRKEGTLAYTYGMTVMQALSEAGGLNDYAKRKKIYILRTENGREYRLDFNYEEVIRGERMEQNVVLLPGDTVVVPQ
jgi:polysaccharide export outer membrane protein